MTTAVFFDLDGTLFQYGEGIVGAQRAGWDAMYVGNERRDTDVPTEATVSDAVSRLLD